MIGSPGEGVEVAVSNKVLVFQRSLLVDPDDVRHAFLKLLLIGTKLNLYRIQLEVRHEQRLGRSFVFLSFLHHVYTVHIACSLKERSQVQ